MMMNLYHTPTLSPNQAGSTMVQTIDAPLSVVWSMARRFDDPKAYKQFVRSCTMTVGDGGIGSVREVMVVSGLPGESSLERLDKLNDDLYVMGFSIIGGDHKLSNYKSTTTLHHQDGGKTVVMESYVVDVRVGSSKEDTCLFADTIIGCNLRSLAKISEQKAAKR